MNNDTILAIDPGLRELGFAVLRSSRLVARDAVNLRRVPKERRLEEAKNQVRGWLTAHQPDVVVMEKTYPHSVPGLNRLHQLTRSARNLATRRHADFATYSPQAVRATVAGNGRAKKHEVAIAVTHLFPQLRLLLTQDFVWKEELWLNMFDAVALALHHQTIIQPPSRSR